MTRTDYSQWGEQQIILDFFGGKVGRFLDLGAFDGLTGSNVRALAEDGWSGLCVEASAMTFPSLLENMAEFHRVQLVNAAVMPRAEIVRLYETGSQISTCMPGHNVGKWVKASYWVPGITPEQIAETFGGNFDFVSIDIEGMELPLLSAMGSTLIEAQLVCVEERIHNAPRDARYGDALLAALARHGFVRQLARTNQGSGNLLYAKEKAV